ncbi:MAG: hypothetical protein QXM52_05900 [Candidatus Bathyarchaeia archaeon]
MYLVDANIFLEVLLGRSKKEEYKRLLRAFRDGKESAIVTDFSIHSIIVIMEGLGRLDALKTLLLSLLAYKELHIYNTTITDEVKATEIAKQQRLTWTTPSNTHQPSQQTPKQ